MLGPWSTLVALWWSCSWRRIPGTVAARQCNYSSGWVRSPTRLWSGTLPVNIPSTFMARTWGKSPERSCVLTFQIKSCNQRGVVHQQDHSPNICPQTLNRTPTRAESGQLNPPQWSTAPTRTLIPPPLRHPLHQLSVKTGRGTRGRPKGLGPPEYPPHLAVPTRIPPWLATKHDPPSPSFVPWAALATCTSRTWAWLSTAKSTASSMCPSSHLGLSTAASCTWVET